MARFYKSGRGLSFFFLVVLVFLVGGLSGVSRLRLFAFFGLLAFLLFGLACRLQGNENMKTCDNLRRLRWTFRELNRIKKADLIGSTWDISTYQPGRTHRK